MSNPHIIEQFVTRIRTYGWALRNFLVPQAPLTLLWDMPGNIGDHLIWAGTELLFEQVSIPYNRISVEVLKNTPEQKRPGSLVIPGSGAFVSRWHEWLPDLVILASKVFESVIILPSQYDISVPIVRKSLTMPNVFPFARELASYNAIKVLGKASLAPDLAWWAMFKYRSDDTFNHERKCTLVSLRTDIGSLLPSKGLRPTFLNDDVSITSTNIRDFMLKIGQAQIIVTDRLHVVVAGLMQGKSICYVDPYDQKISQYLKYHFGYYDGPMLLRKSEDWLIEQGYVHVAG